MRRLILAFGVIGFAGCFLPMYYDHDGPESWSLWLLRHIDPVRVYAVIAAFIVAMWIGRKGARITRGWAFAAAFAFGVVAFVLWPPIPVFVLTGWYAIIVGAYGGCLVALKAALDGDPGVGETV